MFVGFINPHPSASWTLHDTGCYAQAASSMCRRNHRCSMVVGTLHSPVSYSKEDGRHRVMGLGARSDG
jgi:hypothetical protein